jgi:hypothetical protein
MPLRENLLPQTFLIAIELDLDHEHTTPELTHVDLTGLNPQQIREWVKSELDGRGQLGHGDSTNSHLPELDGISDMIPGWGSSNGCRTRRPILV